MLGVQQPDNTSVDVLCMLCNLTSTPRTTVSYKPLLQCAGLLLSGGRIKKSQNASSTRELQSLHRTVSAQPPSFPFCTNKLRRVVMHSVCKQNKTWRSVQSHTRLSGPNCFVLIGRTKVYFLFCTTIVMLMNSIHSCYSIPEDVTSVF